MKDDIEEEDEKSEYGNYSGAKTSSANGLATVRTYRPTGSVLI